MEIVVILIIALFFIVTAIRGTINEIKEYRKIRKKVEIVEIGYKFMYRIIGENPFDDFEEVVEIIEIRNNKFHGNQKWAKIRFDDGSIGYESVRDIVENFDEIK